MHLKVLLCDRDAQVLAAWRGQLAETPEAEIREEDPLEAAADGFLLPGNSFGFLDSGLELRITERFGIEVQDRLRERIRVEHAGELLVGQALLEPLPRERSGEEGTLRYLLYAPLWRVPGPHSNTVNVFLALRAALAALRQAEGAGAIAAVPQFRLAVPALGVGPGGLDPRTSARQIRYALEVFIGRRGAADRNLSQAQRRDRKLRTIPGLGGPAGEADA
jgi:O-acetyl-ADP-ribose deacetylase (regulator of RNase III)